jgi:hypothetical protein
MSRGKGLKLSLSLHDEEAAKLADMRREMEDREAGSPRNEYDALMTPRTRAMEQQFKEEVS